MGSRGSFLILISREFTPIQLGLGFTLNGVAPDRINQCQSRTDAAGSDDRTRRDPVGDAPRIINELDVLFPQAPNPSCSLHGTDWLGTPTMLRAGWRSSSSRRRRFA